MRIKIYLGDKQSGNLISESSYMAQVLNRISKRHDFVVDGDYDYTLGLDGSNAFAKNNIAFIFEPYQVNPRQWDKIKQLSVNKITFCWNTLFCKKHGFEHLPHQWWFIWWNRDMFDEDLELRFSDNIHKENLACMILGNKNFGLQDKYNLYLLRHEIIRFFECNQINDFHLYGDWPMYPHVYKRERAEPISDTLKKYKFCFCPENTNKPIYSNGWVTEKIYNCFRNLTVPIYLGAENINTIIPKECFIHMSDFKDIADIYKYIRHMPERRYQDYLEHITLFYKSEKCRALIHPHTLASGLDRLL